MARVVFVDDNEDILLTGVELMRKGHKVTLATTLEKALVAVSSRPFDVLVTDKNIGTHRGVVPLLDYMERNHPDKPIILYTGEDSQAAERELRYTVHVDKLEGTIGVVRAIERALR